MNLLRAKKKDLKGIMDIIKDAQELLANQNIDQWQNGYPNESIISNDIDNNESYLLDLITWIHPNLEKHAWIVFVLVVIFIITCKFTNF